MRESVKKKWADALRSGEYQQCGGALRNGDSYCCLGVLCDVYRKTRHKGKWSGSRFEVDTVGDKSELPIPVYKWAGLDSADPEIGGEYATILNDEIGADFKTIAKLIQKGL